MPVTISTAILDFGNHIDLTDHIDSFVYIPDSENLLLKILLYFLCQLQSEISKLSDMLAPYWIFPVILKFYDHINIEIEIPNPENLLLDMFHHFL